MCKIVDEWEPLKNGSYILTLSERIPSGRFNKYRIAGVDYDIVHVHVPGEFLLKTIGIKAHTGGGFIGKEVEFIDDRSGIDELIAI